MHRYSTALAGRTVRARDGREGVAVSSEWTPGVDGPTVTVDVDGEREVWWLDSVSILPPSPPLPRSAQE